MSVFCRICWNASLSVWLRGFNWQTSTSWLVYAYVSTIDFGQVVVALCDGNIIVSALHIIITKHQFSCFCLSTDRHEWKCDADGWDFHFSYLSSTMWRIWVRTNASGGERLDYNVGSFISGHGLFLFWGWLLFAEQRKITPVNFSFWSRTLTALVTWCVCFVCLFFCVCACVREYASLPLPHVQLSPPPPRNDSNRRIKVVLFVCHRFVSRGRYRDRW